MLEAVEVLVVKLATETRIAVAMVVVVAMLKPDFIVAATLPVMSAAVVPKLREVSVQTVGQPRLVNLESAETHGMAVAIGLVAAAEVVGLAAAEVPVLAAAAAALATLTQA